MNKNLAIDSNNKILDLWFSFEEKYTKESGYLLFLLLLAYIFENVISYFQLGRNKNCKKERRITSFSLQAFENNNYTIIFMNIFRLVFLRYVLHRFKKENDRYDLELTWKMMLNLLIFLIVSEVIIPFIFIIVEKKKKNTENKRERKSEEYVGEDSKSDKKENEVRANIIIINRNQDNNTNENNNGNNYCNSTSYNNFNSRTVFKNVVNHGTVFLIYSLNYYIILYSLF